MTKGEIVISALRSILTAATAEDEPLEGVTVERNIAVPEDIPAAGLIVIRDGDPGDPEFVLGGPRDVYYQHAIEIEIYAASGDEATRDSVFDSLKENLGDVLENNQTLLGTVYGMAYGSPRAVTEPVEGDDDIKSATIDLMVDYSAATPLG